jgi:hypothetical protein
MYLKISKKPLFVKEIRWIRIIPVIVLVTIFLLSSCQTPPSKRSAADTQSNKTGQALPGSSSGVTVTQSNDDQSIAHISRIVEGKIALVSINADVILPKEDKFPVFSALPLDINLDIDQDAWIALAFGNEAKMAVRVQGKGNPALEFRYEIPGSRYIGYQMGNASFLFTTDTSPSDGSFAAAEDTHEVQGTPPNCSFTQEEAIVQAKEILSQYGLEDGFSPLGVKAVTYNQDTRGYYTVEFERRLFDLPVFRNTLLDSSTGERLSGDAISVALCDQGILRISGTVHKYAELKERQPILTLEQALDVFERNVDFVRVGLGENGEKISQKVDLVQLIYMPVPDSASQKADQKGMKFSPEQELTSVEKESVKSITLVPAWYFSAKSDTQQGATSITNRSAQYRMFINAVTGELIR